MNYAEHARQLSNAELAAVAKAYNDEQKRRSLVRVEGADPEIAALLNRDHQAMYGNTGR